MTQYLLSIFQPDGPPPGPEVMDQVAKDLHILNERIKAAGSWVFTGGLHAASSATVVRLRDDEIAMTDGPYLEGKEHIGGFWIITAEDLDAALGFAGDAARGTGLPIEVRPFRDVPEY
jgi:hypothetical protein